ncbi:MAG TPA: hypothetical protein VGT98_02185 [Candidatus Elarobacter sp.]|nr:hypothetical protein [Candidatus Elarobacter sp.]HEV2737513.1 hypothetical protein [Candidatus Elarobacter sp.]
MQAAHAARRERAAVVGDEHVDHELVVARVVQRREPSAFVGLEIGDADVLERVVPAIAALRRHALRDGVRDLVLVGGLPNELHERRFGQPDLGEQRRAQARREVILAEVAAAQRRTRFVDGARQEHETRESRARIARGSPAQADRAHPIDSSP